jgi:hypothetical protein
MRRELDPAAVAERLSQLRALYIPEGIEEARARLAREQPRAHESLAQVAARSLAELRALCELARVLHMARPATPHPDVAAGEG